jgi:E1A/CREB-binding protein
MMTQTLQGKVMASYAPSSFSIRQHNMDQSTSPIRGIIIQKM